MCHLTRQECLSHLLLLILTEFPSFTIRFDKRSHLNLSSFLFALVLNQPIFKVLLMYKVPIILTCLLAYENWLSFEFEAKALGFFVTENLALFGFHTCIIILNISLRLESKNSLLNFSNMGTILISNGDRIIRWINTCRVFPACIISYVSHPKSIIQPLINTIIFFNPLPAGKLLFSFTTVTNC